LSSNYNEFPKFDTLRRGAILGSIVHAVMLCRYPELSHEQSWDGTNYSIQDSMGSRGTIAFRGAKAVGVFFDKNSPRNPFLSKEPYDPDRFFRGMPGDLLPLAGEEALQYVLDEYKGKTSPIITAAFWTEGESLAAAEEWPPVFDNGAHLIRIQLMDTNTALQEWRAQYEMSAEQVALAQTLFQRKIAAREGPVELAADERQFLAGQAESPDGLDEALESLKEIGIG